MTSSEGAGERKRPSDGYLRALSLKDATLLVIGSIIGSGVFFTPQQIALATDSRAAQIGVWLLGGVIALCGALTYAELGGLFPKAGGVYVFLREAYGGLFGFLYGWAVILVIAPGAIAWVAAKFAEQISHLMVTSGSQTLAPLSLGGQRALAAATILLLTALNVRGVRWGSAVQNVFTAGKLAAILVLVASGFAYAGDPLPPASPASVPPPAYGPIGGFLAAMVPVLFSYGGWQNGTYMAEVKDPLKNVPRSMILGTLVVVATYVSLNVAFARLLEPGAIAESGTFASRAAEAALGPIGGTLVSAGILVSVFGICAAMLLTNPRVAQAVGEDGNFFEAFGKLHPRYKTPALAIAVLGAWSAALVFFMDRINDLLNGIVFADWLFFALVAASLFVFRAKRPDAPRPYRCPGYPVVPAIFLILASAMVVVTIVTSPSWTSRLLGMGVVVSGVPVYALFRRRVIRVADAARTRGAATS